MPNDIGVSVSLVHPIVQTMVTKGHDIEVFYRLAKIEESVLQDPEARLSEEDFERITEVAAAITLDDTFGLHQGQHIEVSHLGILGYVMLHSKTIGQALAAYQKYNVTVCNGYNMSWEVEGDDVVIAMSYHHPHRQPARHCMEDMASSLYHLMIRLSCRTISLKEVHFSHALFAEIDEYTTVLGITPQFNKDSNKIRMSKDILEYPIPKAIRNLRGHRGGSKTQTHARSNIVLAIVQLDHQVHAGVCSKLKRYSTGIQNERKELSGNVEARKHDLSSYH